MLFNSKAFIVFLAAVLAVYHSLGDRGKLWFLLAMSYVFYGFWDPALCGMLIAASAVAWVSADRIGRASGPAGRRLWLTVGVGAGLGALGFFKYYNFFLDSLGVSLSLVGVEVDLAASHLDLILPVGISFYTFQTLSYVIDVYRGVLPPERNFRDFALYVAFFPQLVAGPVERATHLLPQYKQPFRLTRAQVLEGIFLILLGFVKKVCIADRIAEAIDPRFATPVTEPAIAWMSILLFTLNIYVDFSAYSDIAIGLGRLLGYDIRPNFNLPFVVPSIAERWRRWHISMSEWFRDYVYYPLGGNKHGKGRTLVNIMVVMFLSGLWHGASYNFVIWGLLNGSTMVGHRLLAPVLGPIAAFMGRSRLTSWLYYYFCCWNTMCMISLINIFFRSDNWEVAKSYVAATLTRSPVEIVTWLMKLDFPAGYVEGFQFMALVVVAHELQRWHDIKAVILRRVWLWAVCCVAMYLCILIYGIRGPQFIYYQF
jgi:D-alanyl-lipoteichoic acid acyltransferase DltB (MBOAT superfamily)